MLDEQVGRSAKQKCQKDPERRACRKREGAHSKQLWIPSGKISRSEIETLWGLVQLFIVKLGLEESYDNLDFSFAEHNCSMLQL